MIKKKYISLLFLVSSVSLIGTGFSSWVIYAGEPEPGITSGIIGVDTEIHDLIPCLYYVSDSQYGFDYYSYDGLYYITNSNIGFQLMMEKNGFYGAISDKSQDLYMHVALSYTYNGATDMDIFSNGNPYIIPPTKVIIEHSKNSKYFIYSEDITTYSSSSNNVHTHTMVTSILAYSPNKPSLYTLADRYANANANQPNFNVKFKFELNDSSTIKEQNNFLRYKTFAFKFSFNVGEK